MKIKPSRVITCLFTIFVLALAMFIPPAKAATYTVKIGTVVPENSPWGNIVKKYTEKIRQQSKGRLDVKIYWNSSLGSSFQMLRMLRDNRIQAMGADPFSLSQLLPEIQAISLPYLFSNDQQAERVLDGPLFQPVANRLHGQGIELLGWLGGSWSGIGTKIKFIKSPADLKGMKIAIPGSDFIVMVWQRLGGNAVRLHSGEILNAMQTKMVDGFFGLPEVISSAQWYKTIKYFTYTKEVYVPGMIVVNKKFWDQLPPDLKNIFKSNMNGITAETRQQSHGLAEKILKSFRDLGIQTHVHTQAERTLFRSKTLFIRDEFKKKHGSELLNIILNATK